MGLRGKMTLEKEIRCHGDVFHDLFRHKPQQVANITPKNIHSCNLHQGEFGTVGSVLVWEFSTEGKKKTIKVVVEAIDEEKKLVKFKGVGGEMMGLYKEYISTIHVDTKGDDHVVTYTVEYEKVREDVPDPVSILELAANITKDIEAHHAT